MQAADTFWKVDVGNVITLFLLLISFWGAHMANVKRISRDAEEWQEIKTKVGLIYNWFTKYVVGGRPKL